MSVAVALADLPDTAARYGPAAFVLTVGGDGRPHVAHVPVRLTGEVAEVPAGRTTLANARDRGHVVLLWPPFEARGFSLIVDAEHEPSDATGDGVLRCRATKAVLHRPAPDA
jgi:hypothetical protein